MRRIFGGTKNVKKIIMVKIMKKSKDNRNLFENKQNMLVTGSEPTINDINVEDTYYTVRGDNFGRIC